jgi:hypothetical protein
VFEGVCVRFFNFCAFVCVCVNVLYCACCVSMCVGGHLRLEFFVHCQIRMNAPGFFFSVQCHYHR